MAWVPVFVIMAAIFIFSSQPAVESTETSGGLIREILEVVGRFMGASFGEDGLEKWVGLLQTPVRKCAHMAEYTLLYLSLLNALHAWGMGGARLFGAALAVSVLYACTDEFHQLFVPGRSGQVTDVLVDNVVPSVIAFYSALRRGVQGRGSK